MSQSLGKVNLRIPLRMKFIYACFGINALWADPIKKISTDLNYLRSF